MKYILQLFFLFIITVPSFSQTTDTLYFNRKWEQVLKDDKYVFLWILDRDFDSLKIEKEYYKNGLLKLDKLLNSSNLKVKSGEFVANNHNEKKKLLVHFQYDLINDTIKEHVLNKYEKLQRLDSIEFTYVEFYKWKSFVSGLVINNMAYGTWRYLNKQKELDQTIEYENDQKNGYSVIYYNSDDKVDKSDYGKIWQTGYYKNGKLDGKWTFYETDKTIYREIIYENGRKKQDIKHWKN